MVEELTRVRTYLPGAPMPDAPRPPSLPGRTFIWMVVAALAAVPTIAVWRG